MMLYLQQFKLRSECFQNIHKENNMLYHRGIDICGYHRYQKSLNRLLKVCNVPATSAVLIAFFSSFYAAAINSTNEANKVCH
jgi:hypothetical protein